MSSLHLGAGRQQTPGMARLSLYPQVRGQGEVQRAEVSFRQLVRELQQCGPLVHGQGARCLRAACRDFLRKVVLSSIAVARPSLWISVIWGKEESYQDSSS